MAWSVRVVSDARGWDLAASRRSCERRRLACILRLPAATGSAGVSPASCDGELRDVSQPPASLPDRGCAEHARELEHGSYGFRVHRCRGGPELGAPAVWRIPELPTTRNDREDRSSSSGSTSSRRGGCSNSSPPGVRLKARCRTPALPVAGNGRRAAAGEALAPVFSHSRFRLNPPGATIRPRALVIYQRKSFSYNDLAAPRNSCGFSAPICLLAN